jgi:hypothetical protein
MKQYPYFEGVVRVEKRLEIKRKKILGLIPRTVRKHYWVTLEDMKLWLSETEYIIVRAGAKSDFASVPWGLWNLFPKDGFWTRSAIFHDNLYTKWFKDQAPEHYKGPRTRKAADNIFKLCMELDDVPASKRFAMWSAVRLGGKGSWKRGHKKWLEEQKAA